MKKRVGKYELGNPSAVLTTHMLFRKNLGKGCIRKVGVRQLTNSTACGRVRAALHVETKQLVAIKILEKKVIVAHGMTEQIRTEISIMKKITHRNVVSLIDVLVSKSKIYLVLELITGGELLHKIGETSRTWS